MSTNAHDRCSRAIRSLRFNWIQNPEVILDEKLQTIGLNSDYLKNDPELFEVFHNKLYRKLNKKIPRVIRSHCPGSFYLENKNDMEYVER